MVVSFNAARTIGLSLLVFLIVIMGLFFVSTTERITDQVYKNLKLRTIQVERLEKIEDLFGRVRKNYTDYIMNKIDDFQIILTSVNQLIVRSKSLRKTIAQEDRENVESIIKNAERLKTTVTLYSDEAKEDPTGASAIEAEIALKEAEILLHISILNLRRDIKAKQEALDKAMLNEARNGRRAAWLAIGGGIFMGLFVAFFMGRALTRPIRQLVDGTEKIAQGNLDFRVEVKSNDEIGQLAHSFNNMAEDLCFSIKKEKEFAAQAISATEIEKKKSEELQKIKKILEKHINELARSNKELEEFAYIASHDLQEPLRKVKTFGGRLIQKYGEVLGDQGQDYLRRMESATNRMQTLITDLLTYSRVTSKAKPFVSVDLNEIVGDVLSDLEIKIKEVNAQIHVDHLPAIEGDPVQMRQLFQNLIGNALKFSKPEVPPVIEIRNVLGSFQGKDPGEESLINEYIHVIKVADNGIGFEEKYKERIFSVFQRLHGRNEYEGTGIGLAVCRKLVERHGGDIKAKSIPGKGSTFIVRLPIVQPKEEKKEEA